MVIATEPFNTNTVEETQHLEVRYNTSSHLKKTALTQTNCIVHSRSRGPINRIHGATTMGGVVYSPE